MEKYFLKEKLQNKIKNEFLLFLDDLLHVFPNNKNLFMCRIITYQLDKEDVCDMLYNELFNIKNLQLDINTQKNINSLFDINFLNYDSKLTNGIQFKLKELNDLYNGNDYDEHNKCIYNWIYLLYHLVKQLKTTTNQ
jgi:hypothetical protein